MTTVKQSIHDVQVRKEHVIHRQGKDFVLYAGLLDAAHRSGLLGIKTWLISEPTDQNGQTCIMHAEATMPWGTYSGIGDANKANVGPMIAPHIIRMAETRAKARALRDALNVSMAAVEELLSLPSDDDDEAPRPAPRQSSGAAPRPVQPRVQPAQPVPSPSVETTNKVANVTANAIPADEAEEIAKYRRLVSTARRLKLDVEEVPDEADLTEVLAARNALLGRVNQALAAQRAPAGANGNGR